jgi:hypothetical protein
MATGRIGVTPTLRTRWSKLPTTGTTVLSGLDDNSVALVYDVGYEAVYRNGVLLSRGNDYTATNGTTVTLIDATLATDIIEIFANDLVPLTDAISKGQYNAKGALLSATAASTPAVLAVGTNGQVLTADSTAGTGLAWATAASGGMTLITSGSFSGASVTLSSIPSTYKNLELVIRNYLPATNDTQLGVRFNGDSTANRYEYGSVNNSGNDTFERTEIQVQVGQSSSTSQSLYQIQLPDYANSTTWKMFDVRAFSNNSTTTTNLAWIRTWGAYNQTGAISSITLFPASGNFTSGNYFLYGVS